MTFKKVRWKNFLATGNVFTEVDLNAVTTSLIVGSNGHGKSTILDAICFSLFGKAFRNINKPTIVNSINGKECVAEIEFDTNGKSYKIVRGIKPTVFEIYIDGELLNQEASSKDYQAHLEKYILKMNYKSFTQIVILGSASFTPFMQLTSADRRAVIEDLLDIQIFSTMNAITKQKFTVNKERIELNKVSLKVMKEKLDFVSSSLASLKKSNDDRLSSFEQQHQQYAEKKQKYEEHNVELRNTLKDIEELVLDVNKLKNKHSKLISISSAIESNKTRYEDELSFYHDHDHCSTCKQKIEGDFKSHIVEELQSKLDDTKTNIKSITKKISEVASDIAEQEELKSKYIKTRGMIEENNKMIEHLDTIIADIQDNIDTMKNSDSLITENEKAYNDTVAEIEKAEEEKQKLFDEKKLLETALVLLKDGGIKTKIIKQYIPIINKTVNKYLSQMGFMVNFNMDENFNEVIKSRYRDEFSYENFSEGEKTRIDLALLFTWRDISKLKNSVNTNLLLLDEILDGSLDNNGTDSFLKIINGLNDGTNIFVISHKKDQMIDKFDKVYVFEKIKNFAKLT